LVLPLSLSDKWVLRPAHLTRELKGADLIRAEAGDLLRDNPGAALLVEEDALCGAHGAGDEAAFTTQAEQQLLLDRIHARFGATDLRRKDEVRRRRLVDGQGRSPLGLVSVVDPILVGVDELLGPDGVAGRAPLILLKSPQQLWTSLAPRHADRNVSGDSAKGAREGIRGRVIASVDRGAFTE